MKKAEFDRVSDQVRRAGAILENLKKAHTLAEVEARWSDFLVHHHRCFTQLGIVSKSGGAKGWFDKIRHVRSSDDLLKYLMHARNADEHGLSPVTKATPGSIGIKPRPGENSLYIDHLSFKDGRILVGPETAKSALIEVTPSKIDLVDVVDRGVSYTVPSTHDNTPLNSINLLDVASVAHSYVLRMLEEARSFVG